MQKCSHDLKKTLGPAVSSKKPDFQQIFILIPNLKHAKEQQTATDSVLSIPTT